MMNRRLVRGLVGVVVVAGLVTGVLLATSAARADYGAQAGTFSHVRLAGGCMDVAGGNDGNGVQIGNWACNNTPAQQFRFTSAGEIRTLHNRCVSVKGASTADGTIVRQWACDGNNSQKWRFVGAIVQKNGGFLTYNGGIMNQPAGQSGQQWLYVPATQLILNPEGLCLAVSDNPDPNVTTKLTVERCVNYNGIDFVPRQRWIPGSNGSFRSGLSANKCMHDNEYSATVILEDCNGSDAQRWGLKGYLQSALGPASGSEQLLLRVDVSSHDHNYAIYRQGTYLHPNLDGLLWYPLPE